MATTADANIFAVVTKNPGENLAYTVDFTDALATGEELASAVNTSVAPLTQVDSATVVSFDGGTNNAVEIRLSAGAFGESVDVTITGTTDATPTANVIERIVRWVVALRSDVDRVRWLVGDQDTTDELTRDDEIVWALCETNNNIYGAAVIVARGIAGKFARKVETAADDVRVAMQQAFDHYNKLAQELDAVAQKTNGTPNGGIAGPLVTGTSLSTMRDIRSDPDRPPSRARFGFDDNVGTGSRFTSETGD